jgi:hypothetical protein
MDLKAEIAKEKAALEAAKAKISEADEQEIAERAELEKFREQRRAEEARARELDVQRRLDRVRERLGEKAHITAVSIDGYDDTYIIAHDEKAYQAFDRAVSAAASGKKIDRELVYRNYGKALIQDWNGHDFSTFEAANATIHIDGKPSPVGAALEQHLRTHQAQVTPITNEGGRLAGLYAESRKSGR